MPTYHELSRDTADPGQLRERIGIYENVLTNSYGETTETPTVRTGQSAVPAMVKRETSSEQLRAGRPEGKETIKVTVRNVYTILAGDLVLYDSEYWAILGAPVPFGLQSRWATFGAARTDASVA